MNGKHYTKLLLAQIYMYGTLLCYYINILIVMGYTAVHVDLHWLYISLPANGPLLL